MKAVIVECSNGAAVALCEDGTFKKLKNKGYSVGQEVRLKEHASDNRVMRTLSICASFAFVLLSVVGIGSYSYVTPYSYVSLDINPSIEYALNRYDKVIRVHGINDGGQQIVSSIESDIKNQNITAALGVTIKQLEKDKYISREEDNHVIISVCSNNDNKAQAIASRVDTFSQEESQLCSIDTLTVSKEVKDNADSLGITPGKLALINAVAAASVDADFDVSEWTDKTVNELESTIQEASSASGDNSVTANATVVDGDYLSSILDDDTSSDSSVTASTAGEATSSATDNNTTTDNTTSTDTATDSNTDVSSGQTVTPPAVNDTLADESSMADKEHPDKKDLNKEDPDKTGSPNVPETAGGNNPDAADKDDTFTEETSGKLDMNPQTSVDTETDADMDTDDTLTEETSEKLDMNPQTAIDVETETEPEADEAQADTYADDTETAAIPQ